MGTLVANYSETHGCFIQSGGKIELDADGVRRVLASPLRYCLGQNYLYVPGPDAGERDRLCWARIRMGEIDDIEIRFLNDEPQTTSSAPTLAELEAAGVRVGNRYTKRQIETKTGFVPVEAFCSQTLIDSLAENPEALPGVSHEEFEKLCAEIFVRRGFKVDLFRPSKDGGIDFLAVHDETCDPIVLSVQCKQPEIRTGKGRRALGRPVVQQIYGAAKAWDLSGAVAISGSKYSDEARKFAALKPDEIALYDANDLLKWIEAYRWNENEQ